MSTLPFYLRDLPQNWFWRYRTVALIFKIWQTVGKSFAVKCNVYCKHLQQMEKNYNIIFLGIWSSLQSSQEWDSMLCFLFSIFSNLYTIPSTQCSWLLRCEEVPDSTLPNTTQCHQWGTSHWSWNQSCSHSQHGPCLYNVYVYILWAYENVFLTVLFFPPWKHIKGWTDLTHLWVIVCSNTTYLNMQGAERAVISTYNNSPYFFMQQYKQCPDSSARGRSVVCSFFAST